MSEFECARRQQMMAAFVDGDLDTEQSGDLRKHAETCTNCRQAMARFTAIDNELTDWGERLEWENPAPASEKERLLRSMPSRKRATLRKVATGLAIAAALTLVVIAPWRRPAAPENRTPNHGEAQFVEIPYLAPLDPRENATIVRMDIRVAMLLAVGYQVTADPDTVVPADVLVGEDGRAHAVRVLSGIDLNGTGD